MNFRIHYRIYTIYYWNKDLKKVPLRLLKKHVKQSFSDLKQDVFPFLIPKYTE